MKRLPVRLFLILTLLHGGTGGVRAGDVEGVGSTPLRIPGNLRVPAGQSCEMNGTFVHGNVRVERGATLIANDACIEGDVQIESDAVFRAERTRIGDNLQGKGYRALSLESCFIDGSVQMKQGGDFDIRRTTIRGNGDFSRNGSPATIDLLVENHWDRSLKIEDHRGGLILLGNTVEDHLTTEQQAGGFGLQIFANTVYGNLKAVKHASPVELNSNRVQGHLIATDNWAGVFITANFTRGNLECKGNTPPATRMDNVVLGKEKIDDLPH